MPKAVPTPTTAPAKPSPSSGAKASATPRTKSRSKFAHLSPLERKRLRNLVVRNGSSSVYFRVRDSTVMGKVYDAFCKKAKLSPDLDKAFTMLLYEGQRIRRSDTPASLGMEDRTQIDYVRAVSKPPPAIQRTSMSPTAAVCRVRLSAARNIPLSIVLTAFCFCIILCCSLPPA